MTKPFRVFRASHLFACSDTGVSSVIDDAAVVVGVENEANGSNVAIADNGAIRLNGIAGIAKQVSFVGRFADLNLPANADNVTDLGEGMILPGLVNSHTHLEFSSLELPLGKRGIEFTDWVRLVVAERAGGNADEKRMAIQQGLRFAAETGTALLGEIATMPCVGDDYQLDDGPVTTVFLEQLGRSTAALPERQSALQEVLAWNSMAQRDQTHAGASPHAPYSVGNELLDQMLRQANHARHASVAMHLAETLQERELLENLSGPFVELLKDFGVWEPSTFEPRHSILSILKKLATCDRSLVIHGNYLTAQELDFIAEQRSMSIVYCPRTHNFFGHPKYPLDEMLKRGINVAVGTDSCASNPDLCLFAELRHIAREFPQLSAESILRMGTVNGAKALGRNSNQFGKLSTGSRHFAFVPRPDGHSEDAWSDWIFA